MERRHLAVAATLVTAMACGGAPGKNSPIPRAYSNPVTRPDDHGERGPFLWEVVGDRGTSYMFGTIHAGIDPSDGLPESVLEKLRSSRTFIMETDLRSIDPADLSSMARLPDGNKLTDLISSEAWSALTDVARGRFPIEQLETSRPWFAQVAVINSLYPTPVSLDTQLLAEAETAGLALDFLEDWRFQIGLLDEVSGPEDVEALVEPSSRSRKMLDELIDAYRAGDFEALTEAVLDPTLVAKSPDKYRKMFDDRNRAWLEKLRKPLHEGRAFVAVGVGHFCGEAGLVELLRADGFLVRRANESPRTAQRRRTRFGAAEKPPTFVHSAPIPR